MIYPLAETKATFSARYSWQAGGTFKSENGELRFLVGEQGIEVLSRSSSVLTIGLAIGSRNVYT